MIDVAVTQAKLLEDKGVDMIYMGGEFKDKERANLTIEQIQAIKRATNLIIGMSSYPYLGIAVRPAKVER